MGSRNFKNVLPLRDKSWGIERRQNLTKEELSNSSPFPNPLTYKDIDQEFHRWVEEDLRVSFEGKEIPTMDFFSNQRFTEYMQSWESVDDKRNLLLNFKAITRENNPNSGTIIGDSKNIPADRTYVIKRVQARDKNDRPYFIEYRMKQPFAVDLHYKLTLVTNKFALINEFNQMINDKFKAIDCYIRPKGHFVAMKLDNISDDSEYSIDDREFYSQSYSIIVMGYIIREDDMIVEEKPMLAFQGFDGEEAAHTFVEVEELPTDCPENDFYYPPIEITISMDDCKDKIKFHLDCDFHLDKIEMSEYLNGFRLFVNDEEVFERENLDWKDGDEIKINHLIRRKSGEVSEIKMIGLNKSVILNKEDELESADEDVPTEDGE